MTALPKRQTQLCFAVDVTRRSDAESWVRRMKGFPIVLKFGLRLLPLLDADFFKQVRDSGQKIFIDAKLHDIPTQVGESVATWESLGADYLTIHLSGGPAMIRAASAAAQQIEILGVSVLTSIGPVDFTAESDPRSISDVILNRAGLAAANGVDWIVSAATDVERIRSKYPQLKSVTPGLSFGEAPKNADQNRTATVQSAIEKGIEMLVVGRSILSAAKPEFVVESILDLIQSYPRDERKKG